MLKEIRLTPLILKSLQLKDYSQRTKVSCLGFPLKFDLPHYEAFQNTIKLCEDEK